MYKLQCCSNEGKDWTAKYQMTKMNDGLVCHTGATQICLCRAGSPAGCESFVFDLSMRSSWSRAKKSRNNKSRTRKLHPVKAVKCHCPSTPFPVSYRELLARFPRWMFEITSRDASMKNELNILPPAWYTKQGNWDWPLLRDEQRVADCTCYANSKSRRTWRKSRDARRAGAQSTGEIRAGTGH